MACIDEMKLIDICKYMYQWTMYDFQGNGWTYYDGVDDLVIEYHEFESPNIIRIGKVSFRSTG